MDPVNVQTVLGPIKPTDLGRTLTHEHFSLNFERFYTTPPDCLKHYFQKKIDLCNVGLIKQYPYSNVYNLKFDDADAHSAVLEDVKLFKKFGGGTIVENTNHGIKRDVDLMKRVSKETGVHVIAGTGHYVAVTQNRDTLALSQEKMYDLIIAEMVDGCLGSPDVRTGFIGEVGSNWPIDDFEKKAIRATGEAQAHLGCPVSFHPGRDPAAPFEILRIYAEAGGKVSKAIMSHLDRTFTQVNDLLEFAKIGSYCQFDLFGTECSFYQFNLSLDMPSDAQRIDKLKQLRDEGKLDRVLMSHDVHTKHRLLQFGGHGYSHIQTNVLPKMITKGFTQEEINRITIDNPRTWLCP